MTHKGITNTTRKVPVPFGTLKGYTLECYHQGFYPTWGDLKVYTRYADPEGVPVYLTPQKWVTLLRWYRKGYRTYTKGYHKGLAPYGLTRNGTVHDPLWDTLLERAFGTGPKGLYPTGLHPNLPR